MRHIRVPEDLPDTFFYEYDDVVVTLKNNFVIGIATYTAAVADSKGIRQGDSLDKVLAAYGAGGWQVEGEDEIFYEYRTRLKIFSPIYPRGKHFEER